MGGEVVRGPWRDDPRYVVERVDETVPGVPDGAWVCADPTEAPASGGLVLAERGGLRVLARFPVDARTVRVVGVVIAAVIDLVAS